MAEPLALVSAGDESGDVRDDERFVIHSDDSQVRHQSGERVVGDLRTRRRDTRDESGLAGVGEADQPDIGEKSQLEPQPPALTGAALLGERRRTPCRRCEASVPLAATAALGGYELVALGRKVRQ